MEFEWNSLSVQEYNDLRESVGWKEVPYEQAKDGLKNSTVLSVVENNDIVGVARSISDGMQSFIVDVMVKPEKQEHGIGTLLMKELLRYEKETTPVDGEKYVSILAIKGKEQFYMNLGFVERPNIMHGAGMTIKLISDRCYKFEND